MRKGGSDVPEVTLVLAPRIGRRSTPSTASSASSPCRQARKCGRTEGGRTLNELTLEGFTLAYERLDDDMVIVTTAPGGVADFLGDGLKLVDSDRSRLRRSASI